MIDGGTGPAVNENNFNLVAQPEINVDNVLCTNIPINFSAGFAANWTFPADASPAPATSGDTAVIFSSNNRKDVTFGVEDYKGFINLTGGGDVPILEPIGPTITFCGDSMLMYVANAIDDNYEWYIDGVLISGYTDSVLWASTNGTYRCSRSGGCCGTVFSADSIVFTIFPAPQIDTVLFDSIACNGDGDAFAQVKVSGGTPGYTYNWSNGGATDSLFNLSGGTYTVTVSDANNCELIDSAVVFEPAPFTITSSDPTLGSLQNVQCKGACDGYIALNPTGGVEPYNIVWNTGANADSIGSLCPDTFNVVITDANSCKIVGGDTNFVITEPDTLVTTVSSVHTSCGFDNGQVQVASTTGGTPPYNYQWDANANSATTQTVTDLPPNIYAVTVSDANGCQEVKSATVDPSTGMTLTTSSTEEHCGPHDGVDGTATVNVSGGTAPYTYQWDAAANNQTTKVATGLDAGNYTVVVSESGGCSEPITVQIQSTGFVNADFAFTPETGFQPLEVSFTDNSTGNIDTYSWQIGDTVVTDKDPTVVLRDHGEIKVYLTVTDEIGSFKCTAIDSAVIIVEPTSQLIIPNVFTPNDDGINDLFIVQALAMKSVEVIIMNRWGEEVFSWKDIENGSWDGRTIAGVQVSDGVYFVTVNAEGNDGEKYQETGTVTFPH